MPDDVVTETDTPTPEKSAQEIAELQRQLQEERTYREHASYLIKHGGSYMDDKKKDAIRFIMKREGWSDADADSYIDRVVAQDVPNSVQDDEDDEDLDAYLERLERESQANTPTQRNTPVPDSTPDPRVQQLQQELEALKTTQAQDIARRLQEDMRRSVATSLDKSEDLKVLLNRLEQVQGTEGSEERLLALKDEVERQTVENLRIRRASGAPFKDEWIPQESQRALELVLKRYRTVIGDPNKLRGASEAEAERTVFERIEAPKAPSWKGESPADVHANATDFITKSLMSAVSETKAGPSKA